MLSAEGIVQDLVTSGFVFRSGLDLDGKIKDWDIVEKREWDHVIRAALDHDHDHCAIIAAPAKTEVRSLRLFAVWYSFLPL